MEFFINGFLATFGALAAIGTLWFIWRFGPYIIVATLPKVLSKEKQTKFMRDLKKDPWRNADVLQFARRAGWHEEE